MWSDSYNGRNVGLLLNVLGQTSEGDIPYYERLGIIIWTTGKNFPSEPVERISWQWHDELMLK